MKKEDLILRDVPDHIKADHKSRGKSPTRKTNRISEFSVVLKGQMDLCVFCEDALVMGIEVNKYTNIIQRKQDYVQKRKKKNFYDQKHGWIKQSHKMLKINIELNYYIKSERIIARMYTCGSHGDIREPNTHFHIGNSIHNA